MDEFIEDEQKTLKLKAEAAAGVGITLTAGFVSWALRAGALATSFLASMPAWRQFDPMPILGADEDSRRKLARRDEEAEEAERLEKEAEAKIDDLFDK